MNKTELIAKISLETSASRTQVQEIIDRAITTITQELKQGQDVSLPGFGTFTVGDRAARTARNLRTGEKIEIAAKRVPKFKPGKGLKDAVTG